MTAPSSKRPSNVVALPRALPQTPRSPGEAAAPAAPRTNVRSPLGPFIGRERLLGRVAEALLGGVRLVTLLGPPGIGKTRAAQRILELHGARYAHAGGAWFCDLSEARDALGLLHAVAALWPALDAARLADADVGRHVTAHLAAAGADAAGARQLRAARRGRRHRARLLPGRAGAVRAGHLA